MEQIASQIGFLIVFNLVFTFAESGISVGAHVGGLVAGVLCGLLIVAGEQGRYGRGLDRNSRLAIEISLMTVIGVISFILALAVA
jgi:Rhomboid family